MHPCKKTHTVSEASSGGQHPSMARALAVAFFVAMTSTSVPAAQNSYRIAEGHTHNEDKLGSNSIPSLDFIALTTFSKKRPIDDNHLTLLPGHTLWLNNGIWIADIGTLLYLDNDQDGYFSGFTLSIDVDTDYTHAEVYATIDIQRTEGERERLHTTGAFSIYGNSLTDEYRVDVELVRNYPIGDYDLFVSLIDANDYSVVDTLGAYDLTNLARLPLESEDYDNNPRHYEPQTPVPPSSVNADIRAVEYSGASSGWLLFALAIPALIRRKTINRHSILDVNRHGSLTRRHPH